VLFERPANLRSLEGRRWLGILKSGINGGLLYAPWVAVLIVSFINESLTNRSVSTLTLLNDMVYGFANNLWWIALPAFVIALTQWRQKREIRFLWVWGLTILVVSILGNIFADFLFHPRHIMGLMPAFVLLITAAILQIKQRQKIIAWMIVGLWVGAGFVYSQSDTFMEGLARHVSTVPLAVMQTIVDSANTLAGSDDVVVVAVDDAVDEWIYDQPLALYYFLDVDYTVIQLGSLVTDESTNPSNMLPADLYSLDYEARVAAVTENAPDVWMYIWNRLPVADNALRLDAFLRNQGFMACEPFIRTDALTGMQYTRKECLSALDDAG
jgi:hypothetical protein